MKLFTGIITRYIFLTILPYFVFSWLLLSIILFVQQAGRYSEIFFNSNIPSVLIWQLTAALAPNVIAFTCPMAILVGSIIGLSKMQSDNELTALRAAGIANTRIVLPAFVIGVGLTVFAFSVNIQIVPFAAKLIRQISIQAAIFKLESPIEPGVFNSDLNGYTIYVRNGDIEKGLWKNVFIYNEDNQTNEMRLITSKSGRVDFYNDNSELVLDNAVRTTIPANNNNNGKYISENLGEIRFAIDSKKKNDLLDKINNSEQIPDELGLSELRKYAKSLEGKEKIEAQILFYRKIILSLTPLLFSLLGAALVLRFNRSGRGFGIVLALVSLIFYYLTVLLSEQLARTEKLNNLEAGILPLAAGLIALIWLSYSNRFSNNFKQWLNSKSGISSKFKFQFKKSLFQYINYRILDFDIVISLIKYLLLAFGFLCSIFMIFTTFELWKFAGLIDRGGVLLLNYLFYLIPYIYIQLAPVSLMIAILATYILKSRQNEIITWTASGQSIYRLLLPCLGLMFLIGIVNWEIQERILPNSNRVQDELRNQIRNKGLIKTKTGKFWVSNDRRIYSFDLAENTESKAQNVGNLTVYEFSEDNSTIQSIYKSQTASWSADNLKLNGISQKLSFDKGNFSSGTVRDIQLSEKSNPFVIFQNQPSHLNTQEIKSEIENLDTDSEKKNFEISLHKKYSTILLPLIITLFIAPFALSLTSKGKVLTVGYAVGAWLIYMGITNVFEQLGANNFIAPVIAVWSPLIIFSIVGGFLMTKIKT